MPILPAIGTGLLHPKAPIWNIAELKPGEIRVRDALAWGDQVLWIDARSGQLFEQEHIPGIPGALRLNEDEWESLLPQLLQVWHPDRKVVVYCDSSACQASHNVARRLREEVGLTDVYVLHGGWAAWKEAGK